MIFKEQKRIARDLGWYGTSNAVFGPYRDHFVIIGRVESGKFIQVHLGSVPEDAGREIEQRLLDRKKELKFFLVTVDATDVIVKFREAFRTVKKEKIIEVMEYLVDLIAELRLPPSEKCGNCGGDEGLAFFEWDENPALLCRVCAEQIRIEIDAANADYEIEEKHYFRGAIGAFVFCLAGIAGWVLFVYYLNRIGGVFAAGFMWLALTGYDRFNAKRGKLTPLIIIGVSIISVILASCATALFALIMAGLPISTAMEKLCGDPQVATVLRKETVLSLFICSLPLAIYGFTLWKKHVATTLKPAVPVR